MDQGGPRAEEGTSHRPSLGAFTVRESVGRELFASGTLARLSLGSLGSVGPGGELKRSGVRSVVHVRPSLPPGSDLADGGEHANYRAEASAGVATGAPTGDASNSFLGGALERELGAGLDGMDWPQVVLLIVAEVVGTGVLAVPGAVHSLGWAASVAALLGCYLLNLYTGLLLARLRRLVPTAVTLGDLAAATLGRCGALAGWVGLYVYIAFLLGDFAVVLGTSLQATLARSNGDRGLSRIVAYGISGAVLMITNQVRTLQNCGMLCAISTLAIVVAIGLCLGHVLTEGCSESGSSQPDTGRGWAVFGALSSLIMAFAGQSIFMEMMAEMKEPQKFHWALHLALPMIMFIYALVGGIVFAACNENTPTYLLDALPVGSMLSRTVGGLLFVHTLVSYTINQQVLARGLHLLIDPSRANALAKEQPGFWISCLEWFGITTAQLCFAFGVAISVHDFEDLVQLIGAALATPLCLLLPLICFLGAPREFMSLLWPKAELGSASALSLLTLALTVVGTIAAVRNIVLNFGK
mmetsp:Transcript_7082/g.17566  ORF Transcript_7082/g.17566 Transcript_7082/m.17566 type:complete len:526 (-) Transcript_7082:39-1616(-)